MSEISRLRWLCRRGMKELDLLMERYLDHSFDRASQQDQQAFRAILQMPDPELYDLIVGRSSSSDPDIARVIHIMLEQSRNQAGA
jgi:antitoxin CptB